MMHPEEVAPRLAPDPAPDDAAQVVGRFGQDPAERRVQARDLVSRHQRGGTPRADLGLPQDLIGVRIAHAADQPLIAEDGLDRQNSITMALEVFPIDRLHSSGYGEGTLDPAMASH
jgi:hypothetical protein